MFRSFSFRNLRIPLEVCVSAFFIAASGTQSSPETPSTRFRVAEVRCEQQRDPIGVETLKPALSWILESPRRSEVQTAYQIQVASTAVLLEKGTPDLWDSGRVDSDQSIHVPYAGKALSSNQVAFWRVRAWDADKTPSDWSAPAQWSMGLVAPSDWKASWIGTGEPLLKEASGLRNASWIWTAEEEPGRSSSPAGVEREFRRRITLSADPLREAVLYVAADNSAEVYVNGTPIGRASSHESATPLQIGSHLKPSAENTLLIRVRNGGDRPNPAGLLAHLEMVSADNSHTSLSTDGSWEWSPGPADSAGATSGPGTWTPARVLGPCGIQPWGEVHAADAHRPLPIFRKEFEIPKPVKRAQLHVSGLGHHDLYLDGRRVGHDFLDPPWSQYEKTCFYTTHDLTASLTTGSHALGVMLGKGFFNNRANRRIHGSTFDRPLCLIAQLDIELEDGSRLQLVTDESWKWTEGPILHDAIIGGVDYDARRLPDGWATAGFSDAGWKAAKKVSGPGGRLTARRSPPMRAWEEFRPRSIEEPAPGVFVYDFGQNASATPRLRVSGPAGATLRLVYAEQRHGSSAKRNDGKGRVDPGAVSGGVPAYYEYTLKGGGEEVWFPQTFYTGYQFLEMTGAVPEGHPNPGDLPVVRELVSVHVRSAAEPIGKFACSNPLLTKIDSMIDWAVRSNLGHVLTDCPHREKLGWLEVSYLIWPSAAYRYDWSRFGAKIAHDIRDCQGEDGIIYTVAPDYGQNFQDGFRYTPEWGAAGVFIPWLTYRWYGDRRVVEENYDCMRRFVDYMHRTADKDLVPKAGLGDWYDYGHGGPLGASRYTPTELTAMATFHDCTRVVREAALLLGRSDDAAAYAKLAEQIREAFNRKFFNGRDEYTNLGSCQTANAMALCAGLVPEKQTSAVLERILADLKSRQWQQTSGDVGFRYLLEALSKGGKSDVMYRIATRKELGSYAHLVDCGWTSLPEAWDADRRSSMNHCMLGHIQEWFQGYLGGIRLPEESIAFRRVLIRPEFVDGVDQVQTSHRSPYGIVRSEWTRNGEAIRLDVEVPVNASAVVSLPASAVEQVREGGKPVSDADGVQPLGYTEGRAEFEIGSGKYRFEVAGSRESQIR